MSSKSVAETSSIGVVSPQDCELVGMPFSAASPGRHVASPPETNAALRAGLGMIMGITPSQPGAGRPRAT